MHAIRAAMVCAVLALALSASAAEAQSDSTGTAVAVRATHPPRIDGRDDDEIWRIAPVHSGFHEFRPREDSAARFRTEFRIAYDDRNLYVFVRAFDSHPDSIMHALSRHDVRGPSDQLKVIVDAYHDRRSGVEFAVNPDGVKREYAISVDANEDESWNGIWEVATTVDSLGWNAEFRIPFSQLRYADAPSHVFGFGIWRDIERFKERTAWPYYRESKAGITSQLGELTGITQISSSHTLEVTPYVVAKNSSRTLPVGFTRVQQETIGGDRADQLHRKRQAVGRAVGDGEGRRSRHIGQRGEGGESRHPVKVQVDIVVIEGKGADRRRRTAQHRRDEDVDLVEQLPHGVGHEYRRHVRLLQVTAAHCRAASGDGRRQRLDPRRREAERAKEVH